MIKNENEIENLFCVYSMKKAAQMMLQGFRPIQIQKNFKNNKFFVFKFENTDEFRDSFYKLN